MTTSLTPSLAELAEGKPIPEETLVFLRERLHIKLHQLVLREFLRQSRATGLKQSDLAKRLRKHDEQISRWLAKPGNREIDTISDLLAAMGVVPRDFDVVSVTELIAAAEAEEQAAAELPGPIERNGGAIRTRHLSLVPKQGGDPQAKDPSTQLRPEARRSSSMPEMSPQEAAAVQ